jgi:transmembrane sensor
VLRGRVAVHAPEGSHELSAGEAGWYPRASRLRAQKPEAATHRQRTAAKQAAPAPETPWQAQAEAATHRQRTAAKQAAPAPEPGWQAQAEAATHQQRTAAKQAARAPEAGWQAQAERGNFERAFELMPRTPEQVSNDVEALLLAADAARLSGHPAQALPFLRQVTERHPRDPRASLAAFTLGGVLLNQLDRPREAEAAYALARSLALRPALAQDALARQVEAAHRAGDTARMRELAAEYLRRYPDGRRVKWVRDTSGL